MLDNIKPFLNKNGYSYAVLINDSSHVKLQIWEIFIAINYNEIEASYTLWIGRNDNLIEISNQVLKGFFDSEMKLSGIAKSHFFDNIILFFETIGKPLIANDINALDKLQDYYYSISKKYTDDILYLQFIKTLENAWESENYNAFVKIIELNPNNKLSGSYKKKYEIAFRKINPI